MKYCRFIIFCRDHQNFADTWCYSHAMVWSGCSGQGWGCKFSWYLINIKIFDHFHNIWSSRYISKDICLVFGWISPVSISKETQHNMAVQHHPIFDVYQKFQWIFTILLYFDQIFYLVCDQIQKFPNIILLYFLIKTFNLLSPCIFYDQ